MALASVPVAAQQAGNDTGELPLSLVIDSAMTAHEQDIKDRMFDYEFDHAGSEAAKVAIVKKRSDDLAATAQKKQALLKALENQSSRGLIPDDRLKAMVNVTKITIERMTGSSKKLQEKSKKLDKDAVARAVAGLDNVTILADSISKIHGNTPSRHT